MNLSRCRILLAIEPTVLEGALAELLAPRFQGEIVQRGRSSDQLLAGEFDVAVVSDDLPVGIKAGIVITLPDTRGSAGVGTVMVGASGDEVRISTGERVIELIEQYAARHTR